MSVGPAPSKCLRSRSYLTVWRKLAEGSLKLGITVLSVINVTTGNYAYYFSDYDPESWLFLNYLHRADFFKKGLILQAG